jgi:hypothetical protein
MDAITVRWEKPLERAYWRRQQWDDLGANYYRRNYLWAILPFDRDESLSECREVYLGEVVYEPRPHAPWSARCGGKERFFDCSWDAQVWMHSLIGQVIVAPEVTDHSKPNETPQELSPEDAIQYTEKFDYSIYEWRNQSENGIVLCEKGGGSIYGWISRESDNRYLAYFNCRLGGQYLPVTQCKNEFAAKAWVLWHAAKERKMSQEYLTWLESASDLNKIDDDLRLAIIEEREEIEAARHREPVSGNIAELAVGIFS